jgi:hypothetical protein
MNLVGTVDGILLLAALWALVLLGLFLLASRILSRRRDVLAEPGVALREPPDQSGRPVVAAQQGNALTKPQAVLLVIGVALIARLVPNFLLPMGAGYDVESYQMVGNLVLSGDDVYTNPDTADRHPYLPLQMYWMGFAVWLAEATGIPFVKIVRLAPIGADVGIALLLFLHLRRSVSMDQAVRGGLLYALNPVSVFVSAYHGQFDAIPALALLLAVMTLENAPLCAGGWLGLGILNKSWPVLALPCLWSAAGGWRARWRLLAGVVTVPLLGLGLYLAVFRGQIGTVLARAMGYNWGVGVWGYTYLFRLFSVLELIPGDALAWLMQYGRYITLAALGLAWALRARKESPGAGTLTVLVVFFAVTHAFSIQYLVWLLPFAIGCGLSQSAGRSTFARQDRWLTRYTLGACAYMLLTYTTLALAMRINLLLPWPQADWFIIMPAGLPVWLVTVAWARSRLLGEREPA